MGEPKMQKSEIEMAIEKKESASPHHFEALRDDLFREAAELISEVPSAKIAIVVTPPAGSESDVSMYSFGHPSAQGVFKTFLQDKGKGKAPMEDEDDETEDEEDETDDETEDEDDETEDEDDEEEKDLSPRRGWWNDAKKFESMSPEQVKAALDQIARLRNNLTLEREARLTAQGSSGNPEAEAKP